jgi:hypothetical protein
MTLLRKKSPTSTKEPHLTAKVLVLSFGETGPSFKFSTKCHQSHRFPPGSAKLIEMRKLKEKIHGTHISLSSLQLILAPPFQEWKSISLSRFYRENPSSKSHFLKDIPLALMQPTESYLKNPDLKRELWKMLSSLLSTST